MIAVKNLKWWVWALAAFFYFYEYLLRVSPNVMVPELMQAFDITTGQLGVLIASFLLVYSPMQLPVGVLMDRYGARILLTIASLGCGIGALLFAVSHTLGGAYAGRLLIGVSSSFAFVGMVYVCSHWFERNKRALLVGLANSISMLGAFAGGGPLSIMVERFGWRTSLFFWGIIGIILAAAIFLLIRKGSHTKAHLSEEKPSKTLFEGLKIFCKGFYNWINAIVALLFYTVTTAIGGLWGVPFIQNNYHVPKEVASFAVSMLFFGWLIGSPVMGLLSDRVNNRKWVIVIGALITFLCFTPVVYFNSMSIFWVYILIFLTGFFSSAELLNFTYATEINPSRVKGASIAVTNFIVSAGGVIVQPLIGFLLENSHGAKYLSQIQTYSEIDFKKALTILPVCLLAAALLGLLLKENKRQEEPS